MKKAQAAMEFLLSYGWAILVVLAAIAALTYFGVVNTDKFLPFSCTFPAGTACFDKPVINGQQDEIQLALKNTLGFSITIAQNISVSQGCTAPASLTAINGATPPTVIDNDEVIIMTVSCPGLEEGRSKSEITFSYLNQDTGLSHSVVGYITGVSS